MSFNTADPSRGRLEGVSFNTADPSRGKALGDGGRREKHLPWLGQAAASASAPVNAGTVLLSDNDDKRLCPREDTGNHSRPLRAEEVQKRSFCRRSFPHFFRCWKKWGRRRQRKRSRRGAKLSPAETKKALALGREIAPAPAAGGGRKKDRRGRSFCVFLGCAAHCALLCNFWSMAVNSGGRGQWSSTGSPVRGWTKRRPVAWRHWPVRPGTGFLAP